MRARHLFWPTVAVTLAVYGVMVFWSIPVLSRDADGLAVFDLRPGGYSFEEARAFLAALSPEGVGFYTSVQHRLDAAYPVLLAITLGWSILRLTPRTWGLWRYVLAATAVPGMVFDHLENASVSAMLALGAEGITPSLVDAASFNSQAKAATSSVAMTVLLILLLLWAFRRWRTARLRQG